MTRKTFTLLLPFGAAAISTRGQNSAQNPDLGFTDTPMLPGQPYHVHDPNRPKPPLVTPASVPGGAPSDAVVLFDGKDLSRWKTQTRSGLAEPKWKVENGYFEVAPNTGDLVSIDQFGDCQLHVEWASPARAEGNSQGRGNSGVLLMRRYEIQVLDMYNNITYADGGAGAIYGQFPPLATAPRKPGEWQSYDIVFEAPQFDGEKVVKPAYFTVFWNGVVVHNRKESIGPMVYRQVAQYKPHGPQDSLMLQNHGNPVRYRNIWVRRLRWYDGAEKRSS